MFRAPMFTPGVGGSMIKEDMYKHILAALDGSPRTENVLRTAERLAVSDGAALHLCRAVNIPLGMPIEAWALSGDELAGRLVEDAQRELAALRQTLQTPLPGEILVRLGRPAQVVVDLADAIPADLIVVGSHGYYGIDRLLGTTAARVVNHARCSVLVVRDHATTAAS
jgi:nucleotide-binding universal stress UspA family protein